MVFATKNENRIVNDRKIYDKGCYPQSPGIRSGPLVLCSGGTFLFVVGVALMLPGRDINDYQGSEQPHAQVEVLPLQDVKYVPHHLTSNAPVLVFQGKRRRNFHWHRDCPLLHSPLPLVRRRLLLPITFAQAQSYQLRPCFMCHDLDHSTDSSSEHL